MWQRSFIFFALILSAVRVEAMDRIQKQCAAFVGNFSLAQNIFTISSGADLIPLGKPLAKSIKASRRDPPIVVVSVSPNEGMFFRLLKSARQKRESIGFYIPFQLLDGWSSDADEILARKGAAFSLKKKETGSIFEHKNELHLAYTRNVQAFDSNGEPAAMDFKTLAMKLDGNFLDLTAVNYIAHYDDGEWLAPYPKNNIHFQGLFMREATK